MSRVREIKRVLVAGALVALVSCSTVRVESDYNPQVDFSTLRSYAWMPDPPDVSSNPLLHNSILDGRIRSAVDRTLAGKGIRQVEVSQADFLVNYYVNLEQKIRVDTVPTTSYGYGYGGWYGGTASETRVQQYEEGTLILDVVDPEKDELLWRGSGSTRVSKKTSPEAREKKIDEIVSKLLESFPPAPGS
jgi:hypothetical protein